MKFLTLILAAVMTLAFSLPAEAAVSKLNRCKAQVTRAERKYATCVAGAAARALRLGSDPDSVVILPYPHCYNRRGGALTRIAEKFPSLPEADCGLDTASSAARAQAALVVAGLADAADGADSDCFRKGACGAVGWNIGAYTGVTKTSSGCDTTYDQGANWQPILAGWGNCDGCAGSDASKMCPSPSGAFIDGEVVW